MAPNAILGLLATLLLFSGCIGQTTVDVPATEAPAEDAAVATPPEPEPDQAPTSEPAPLPKCPDSHSNSNGGVWTQVGGEYIVSPRSGNLAIYYRESNGCKGLQTEEEWAHNPDTKVAEVPYPLVAGRLAAPSEKA